MGSAAGLVIQGARHLDGTPELLWQRRDLPRQLEMEVRWHAAGQRSVLPSCESRVSQFSEGASLSERILY